LTLEIRIGARPVAQGPAAGGALTQGPTEAGIQRLGAELDEAVTWQSATLGVVAISRSRDYLHGLIEEVERAARRMTNELGAEFGDTSGNTSRADE